MKRAFPEEVPTSHLLLVCTANIARSPSAELLARQRLAGGPDRPLWEVSSAGVHAVLGAGLDPTLGRELRLRGIDPANHRARQVDRASMEWADLILTFETRHRSWILGQWPDAARRTFSIRRAAALLMERPRRADALDFLRLYDGGHTADDDFADPYGLGPEAARMALNEIEELLDVIVPALES